MVIGEGDFWIPNEGCRHSAAYIYKEIFEEHLYENDMVEVEPGDVVLDVGANVGMFTTFALNRGASSVISMEPDTDCFDCLKMNTMHNKSLSVLQAAWAFSCYKDFVSYDERKGSSHINGAYTTEADAPHKYILGIRCIAIDALLKSVSVDFIKMDIEGSEKQAILGAVETIARCKPKLAIAAYHHEDDLKDIPKLLNLITPYECFVKESPMGYNEKILLCRPIKP